MKGDRVDVDCAGDPRSTQKNASHIFSNIRFMNFTMKTIFYEIFVDVGEPLKLHNHRSSINVWALGMGRGILVVQTKYV